MAHDSPKSLAVSATLLGVLVIALLGAGALAQPVLAQQDGDHEGIGIEREGDTLNVTIDQNETEAFDEALIEIAEQGANETAWNGTFEPGAEDGDIVFETVSLFDLPSNVGVPDAQINVTLFANEAEIASDSEELNLRAVDDDLGFQALDEGELILSASEITNDAAEIPIEAGDTSLDASVEQSDDGWELRLSLAELHEGVDIFEQFTLTALPDVEQAATETTAIDLTDGTEDPELTVEGGELRLEHALFFEAADFSVGVDDYRVVVDVPEHGVLNLSQYDETRLTADEMVVTESDEERFSISPLLENDDVFEYAAEALDHEFSDDLTSVTHELLTDGDTYILTVETDDGTLSKTVEAVDGQISFSDDVLLAMNADSATLSLYDTGADGSEQRVIFSGVPVDEPALETVEASLTGSTLNLSNVGATTLEQTASIWLQQDDQVIEFHSDSFNATEETLDIGDAEMEVEMGSNVSLLAVAADGEVIERLELTITEPGSEPTEAAVFQPHINQWFLLTWGGLTLLLAGLFAFSTLYSPPVVSSIPSSGSWFISLQAVNALLASFIGFVLVRPELFEFSAGFVLSTLLVCGVYLWMASPSDWNIKDKLLPLAVAILFGALAGVVAWILLDAFDQSVRGAIVGGGYGTVASALILVITELASDTGSSTSRSSGTGGRRGATSAAPQPRTVTATVELFDSVSGNTINSRAELVMKRSGERRTETIEGGRGQVELPEGEWTFNVQTGGTSTRRQQRISQRQHSVRIDLPGRDLDVRVQTEDGNPIPSADVVAETGQYRDRGSTDRQGRYAVSLPIDATTVEVAAEHKLFESQTQTLTLSNSGQVTFTLVPREGDLDVSVSLGREPVSDVSVTATRRGEPEQQVTGRTDSRGSVQFPNVLIGQYDLDVTLPVESNAFTVSVDDATIRDGQTEQCSASVQFNYSLRRQDKTRIRELREELNDIARSSRRDDVIPNYYASVLHEVLDGVERIPRTGYPFLQYNQDPDAVVNALIVAVEDATTVLSDVLSSQRNVNLFSACSDLPDATVEWEGNVDIQLVLQQASQGIGQQRADVGDRFEAVDDRITTELRDLAEVSPAREMWDGVREMVRGQSGLDELEVAASIFVARQLLDAIESLFERQALRRRLEQTVY